ncbi:FAR1 DNA-binding domain, partial [Sesbania bispinosa]
MDKSGDDPVVKLNDDKDLGFDHVVSSNDICSEQHNEVGDKNDPGDVHVTDEQGNRISGLKAYDIRSLQFGSEFEAYVFYSEYARVHGFVVRRDEIGRDSNGNMNMRQYVCNREGLRNKKHFLRVDRKKEHKPITRTNCQAKLRIHLDYKTSKWKVVSFEECHNHDPTHPKFVHLQPAYRGINDADKAQNFDQILREHRNNELIVEFKSLCSEPVMTTSLQKFEVEASKIFTLEIFREVRQEIEEVDALSVLERVKNGDKVSYKMTKDKIFSLTKKLENQGNRRGAHRSPSKAIIGDPTIVKTKDAPTKKGMGGREGNDEEGTPHVDKDEEGTPHVDKVIHHKSPADQSEADNVIKEKEKHVHGSQMKENKRICLTKKSVKGTVSSIVICLQDEEGTPHVDKVIHHKSPADQSEADNVIKEKEKPVHGSQMKENKRICSTRNQLKALMMKKALHMLTSKFKETILPLLELSVKFMKASNPLLFHMELSLTSPNVYNPLIPVEFDLRFPKFFNQVFMGVYAMKFPK